MNKEAFLAQLRRELSGLPQKDAEERVTFYAEMIEDRMEEGLSEEKAVSAVGSIDEIILQAAADAPLSCAAKEPTQPKKQVKVWEIALLVLGSPIWLSLGIAALAVILSLYIVLWCVIISLWAVFASLVGGTCAGIAAGVIFVCHDSVVLTGIAIIGGGIVCAGLAILLFFVCKLATKSLLILTKKIAIWAKNGFVKKEEAS